LEAAKGNSVVTFSSLLCRAVLPKTVSMPVLRGSHLICVAFFAFCSGNRDAYAQELGSGTKWEAPASAKQTKNPISASESSLAAGKKIYFKRCVNCHGKTGNGDGPDAFDLGIHPAKFSDPRMREESDGALFWKITHGKKPMPAYESRLSPAERWNVINYLRTLAK
jgi:mono/diheme cytochrome c family protein